MSRPAEPRLGLAVLLKMSVLFTVNIAAHGFRWKTVILTGLRPAEDRGSFNEWDTLGTRLAWPGHRHKYHKYSEA